MPRSLVFNPLTLFVDIRHYPHQRKGAKCIDKKSFATLDITISRGLIKVFEGESARVAPATMIVENVNALFEEGILRQYPSV